MITKEKVLEQLEIHKGSTISGSSLAAELGVSRNAIWKAITSLREDGYHIDAGSNRGYCLSSDSDLISREAILPLIHSDIDLKVLDVTGSTNKDCKILALDEPDRPAVVIANRQTAGRGRRGRTFYSPSDTGIYISFLFKPRHDITSGILITVAVSVAVARAAEEVSGRDIQIKWVNDLYSGGKKICGILTEAVTDMETSTISYVIPGIGINCSTKDFPDTAGSVAGSLGGGFSRNELAAKVIDNVMDMLPDLDKRDFLEYYREHSMVLGKDINYFSAGDDKGSPARAKDIDRNGGLIIELPDGTTKTLNTGEISIRLK
mgnify:CR=1 FL=1